MRRSTFNFNKELLFGEIGALLMANVTAVTVSRFTANAAIISGSAVAATLVGGTLFWLAARIYDQVKGKQFQARAMASDIGYFTPAAIVLGIVVYDPSIYLTSHHFLTRGDQVGAAVIAGQIIAFLLFLISMNIYRILLLKVRGKCL